MAETKPKETIGTAHEPSDLAQTVRNLQARIEAIEEALLAGDQAGGNDDKSKGKKSDLVGNW